MTGYRRPRALRAGDRLAIVAPASPFDRAEFDAGVAEVSRLGFVPVYDERVFARHGYLAGDATRRADALREALRDASIAGILCARGGYGSVQLLPLRFTLAALCDQRVQETPRLCIIRRSSKTTRKSIRQRLHFTKIVGPVSVEKMREDATSVLMVLADAVK